MTGYGVGSTATWYQQNGFYADGQAQATWFDSDLGSDTLGALADGNDGFGYALSVVLRIRPAPRELKKVAELAQRTPEVVECHRITGDDCYLMRLWVRDVIHLEEIIDRFAPYGQTTTSIVQSSPVLSRAVPLEPS